MTTVRFYQLLAFVNLCVAVLIAVGAAMTATSVLEMEPTYRWAVVAGLVLVLAIAVGFGHGGVAHLRRPTRKTALVLAVHSAILVWFVSGPLINVSGLKSWLGPAAAMVAILVAWAVYRFWLRPAAIRAFPEA